jgi:hypothetical protein
MQPSQKARDWSSLEQSLESAFSVPSQPFVTPQPVVFQPAFQQQSQQDDWGDFQVKSFSDNLSTPDGSKGQFFISRHHAHVVWNEPTKNIAVAVVRLFNSCSLSSMLEVCQNSPYSHRLLHQISAMNTRCTDSTDLLLQICIGLLCQLTF